MSKFKNGDRVRAVRDNPVLYRKGDTGKVICYRKVDNMYLVRFDDKDSILREHWLCEESIELLKKKLPTIVITTDGKTTTAIKRVGKVVIGKTTSVCGDDDDFDFDIGAAVAISRLIGGKYQIEENPKPRGGWSGKVVCLETNKRWWTPGKCYDVSDALIIDDEGVTRDRGCRKTFADFFGAWWTVGDEETQEARFAEVVKRDG